MGSKGKSLVIKISIALGFAATVVINFLATTGRINGLTTAAVSDAYPTLFTPKGYTFSIWGIIYLLLLVYMLFQLFSSELGKAGKQYKTAVWFVISSALNVGWIFAWHYDQIILSAILMCALLLSLIRILMLISGTERTLGYMFSLEFPFGMYAGWITVATIANTAVLLLDIGWTGFGIPWFLWIIAVFLIATLVVIAVTRITRNMAYPVAVFWGFTGVLTRYLPDFKLDLQSDTMWIVIALILCLLILTIRWIDIVLKRLK